jgi:Styrene monooxygenase A putative substrate binding domain
MRRITIVGGGQSGLQLALGLQKQGYDVTVVSNRTADDVYNGRVMSSQCMFHTALDAERELGINFWEADCPKVEGISLQAPGPDGKKIIDWSARLDHYAQAVDQRIKIPGWMKEFTEKGGNLVIKDAGIADLEEYAKSSDLVVVAAGKGDVVKLFERDAAKSPYDKPQRALALTYVTGMTPRPVHSAVCFNLIPTVGEYFVFPSLTTTGPCEIMVFEGIPGGPMDCWGDVKTPEQHLEKSLWILNTFTPWEAERCRNVALTDDMGILSGRFPPTVRKPIGTLPSGKAVFGMADTVVLNDPITGQGSNNAAKSAHLYYHAILERGDRPFDAGWMQATFDKYWDYAQFVTGWTNALLAPPPPHVLKLLVTANQVQGIADAFVNAFDDPRKFFPWLADPAEADKFIEKQKAA